MAKIKKSISVSEELYTAVMDIGDNLSVTLEELAWESILARQRKGENIHYEVLEDLIEKKVKKSFDDNFSKLSTMLEKTLTSLTETFLLMKYVFVMKENIQSQESYKEAYSLIRNQAKTLIIKSGVDSDPLIKDFIEKLSPSSVSLGNVLKGSDEFDES